MSVHGSAAFLECSIRGTAVCEPLELLKRIVGLCGQIEEYEDRIWELVPCTAEEQLVIDRPILLICRSTGSNNNCASWWLESSSASDKSAIRTSHVRTVKRLTLLDRGQPTPSQIAAVLGMEMRGVEGIVQAYCAKHYSGVEFVVSLGLELVVKIQAGNQAAVVGCEAFLGEVASWVQDLVPVMSKGL